MPWAADDDDTRLCVVGVMAMDLCRLLGTMGGDRKAERRLRSMLCWRRKAWLMRGKMSTTAKTEAIIVTAGHCMINMGIGCVVVDE
mmetsp:Transcript_11657/g.33950  ORF Transcript_11657/g.33950 Transcript_11657/m.33950 type:complete len:86 (+) Transcript_11657:3367-3624(+)